MGAVQTRAKKTKLTLKHKISSLDPKYKKQIKGSRGVLRLKICEDQDFLSHHMHYQDSLSQYITTDKIRRRQILEHLKLILIQKNYFNQNFKKQMPLIQKSWMQRLFIEIIEDAEKEYFTQDMSYDQVRRKISDRYLFELYQYKQFLDAGYGQIIFKESYQENHRQQQFGWIVSQSDTVLFPMLKELKKKFPQVADTSNIVFPEVKELKKQIDLFDHFNCKSYLDPEHLNLNTIFFDINFLINRSLEEFQEFDKDLKHLLGQDTLTDSKVKIVEKGDRFILSASPVRRIFIKWVEVLIERYQKEIENINVMNFIKSKFIISENFHIRSVEGSQTTHNSILLILTELLEQIKFLKPNQKHPKFGFFIYDLLRCKTHRGTPNQIMEILEKLQATTLTKSGKKFQVVRIKNRFKTPNRDLMVNFRYGDILVGQAQLCVDNSDISQKIKKTNKFNHYLYELQRGLFGPTIELMMQYQDFYRVDVQVQMFKGLINKRNFQYLNKNVLLISHRKCINNHKMYKLQGEHFLEKINVPHTHYECQFCNNLFNSNDKYDYCFKCGVMYCDKCQIIQKQCKVNLSILNSQYISFTTQAQLKKQIEVDKCVIVLFYHPEIASSIMAKDYFIYLRTLNHAFKSIEYQQIVMMSYNQKQVKAICKKFNINKFPSMCIFDSHYKLRKAVIGCSLQFTSDLFQIKKNIQSNNQSYTNLFCLNHEQKVKLQFNDHSSSQICSLCQKSTNKIQKLEESILSRFVDRKHLLCKSCKRNFCHQCSLFAYENHFQYQDCLSVSYLSYKQNIWKPHYCNLKHQLKYQNSIKFKDVSLHCTNCKKHFFYNNEIGFCYCSLCENYILCPQCLKIKVISTFQATKHNQLVTHLIQATASQGSKCVGCHQFYKKVYKVREKQKRYFGIQFQDYLHRWRCKGSCQKGFDNRITSTMVQLHLACFTCDIQICMSCAEQLRILYPKKHLENHQQIETSTKYICPDNHTIFKTNKIKDLNILSFSCDNCKSMFYTHTLRFQCKQCDKNWCLSCGSRKLNYLGNQLLCHQQHVLTKLEDTSRLLLGFECRNCHKVVEKGNLNPVLTCSSCNYYFICFECRCQMTKQSLKDKNNLQIICSFKHFMSKKFDFSRKRFCKKCLHKIRPPYFKCQHCTALLCLKCSLQTAATNE